MAEEKAHKASPRKIEKARKEGNILKSQDLSQVLLLPVVIISVLTFAAFNWNKNRMLLQYSLERGLESPLLLFRAWTEFFFETTVFSLVLGGTLSILTQIGQIGFKFEWGLLSPKFERLDGIAGGKRLFSRLPTFGLSLLKLVVLFLVFSFFFWFSSWRRMLETDMPLEQQIQFLATLLLGIFGLGMSVSSVFAGGDYFLQRRKFFRELSMDHDEVRREYRESEGDPELKARRKGLHQALANQDVVARVRTAKVLIVKRAVHTQGGL